MQQFVALKTYFSPPVNKMYPRLFCTVGNCYQTAIASWTSSQGFGNEIVQRKWSVHGRFKWYLQYMWNWGSRHTKAHMDTSICPFYLSNPYGMIISNSEQVSIIVDMRYRRQVQHDPPGLTRPQSSSYSARHGSRGWWGGRRKVSFSSLP